MKEIQCLHFVFEKMGHQLSVFKARLLWKSEIVFSNHTSLSAKVKGFQLVSGAGWPRGSLVRMYNKNQPKVRGKTFRQKWVKTLFMFLQPFLWNHQWTLDRKIDTTSWGSPGFWLFGQSNLISCSVLRVRWSGRTFLPELFLISLSSSPASVLSLISFPWCLHTRNCFLTRGTRHLWIPSRQRRGDKPACSNTWQYL